MLDLAETSQRRAIKWATDAAEVVDREGRRCDCCVIPGHITDQASRGQQMVNLNRADVQFAHTFE